VPKLKGTGVFANANWRSTRSEEKVDDVVASAGVQQTYKVGGLPPLTIRVGYTSRNEWTVTPIPWGHYF